jgi:dihydroorotate dehydrogenase
MYKRLVRPILFMIDPERVHHLVFGMLGILGAVPGANAILTRLFAYRHPRLHRNLMGLHFANPVGLAAGFDKDARLVDELAALGFGFIEIGTVTVKAQPGNDKPRLFRLPKDEALVNRMGFNNEGVEACVERLKQKKSNVVVGGNIGKNKSTPLELALTDYAMAFEALYPVVDYFVVNVSSPNTPGLRQLQEKEPLRKLLSHVKGLSSAKLKPKPVLLKISPDLTVEQLDDVIEVLRETKTDGVIATNTTLSRENLLTSESEMKAIGMGGLSGKPLRDTSTKLIRYLRRELGPEYPIIGVGGIMTPEDALEKLQAGADLIQIYTGFVYEGPGFVKSINKEVARNS